MQPNVYVLQPNVYADATQCIYPMYIEYTLGDKYIYIGMHLMYVTYIHWVTCMLPNVYTHVTQCIYTVGQGIDPHLRSRTHEK